MKSFYIDSNTDFSQFEPVAACIGHFDGLHRGHQALIKHAQEVAKNAGIASALITFEPDPVQVLTDQITQQITAFTVKKALIAQFGIDYLYIIRFDLKMAHLSERQFMDDILLKMNIRFLTCGFDFRYGYQGSGDVETLKNKYHSQLRVDVIEAVKQQQKKISSTWIIECLSQGNIALTNQLLGYPFTLKGEVIKGHQVGRKLNFPTANLAYADNQALPKIGVYVGLLSYEGSIYQAMINVGKNPTFYEQHQITIEAHILEFKRDIYHQIVSLYFLDHLRDEIKYDSAEQLIAQLNKDLTTVKSYFGEHEINISLFQ
ncbi:MAG: bifunctional riboflavin kinase/FAD synthetase [Erysipelotrichaceae bacterium]|nr:bifunctional riboflavin kinase/FAD synthetase [Erysipelotrichaceae bacterium]